MTFEDADAFPDSTSQMRTVLSSRARESGRPSALQATLKTEPECPSRTRRQCSGLDVPDAHGVVIRAREDVFSVRAEGDGAIRHLWPKEMTLFSNRETGSCRCGRLRRTAGFEEPRILRS